MLSPCVWLQCTAPSAASVWLSSGVHSKASHPSCLSMPSYPVEYTAVIKAAFPCLAIQWSTQQSSHPSCLYMPSYPVEYTAKPGIKAAFPCPAIQWMPSYPVEYTAKPVIQAAFPCLAI